MSDQSMPVVLRSWKAVEKGALLGSADGVVLRDGKGKTRYAPIFEWSAAVVEAVEREHGKFAVNAGGAP